MGEFLRNKLLNLINIFLEKSKPNLIKIYLVLGYFSMNSN